MKNTSILFKSMPLTVSGLSLGMASLGNILYEYNSNLKLVFSLIALLLLLLISMKVLMFPKEIKHELNLPMPSSMAPTYPLAIMIISLQITSFTGYKLNIVWALAFAIYLILLIWFSFKFLNTFRLDNIYLPYLIPYIGLAIVSMTAHKYNMQILSIITFYLALFFTAIFLVPMYLRYIKHPVTNKSFRPSFTILSAPLAIILVSYLEITTKANIIIVTSLLLIYLATYIIVLVKLTVLLKTEFYPSIVAFTFPMIIVINASKLSYDYYASLGYDITILKYFYAFQTLLALILTIWVTIRFIKNSFEEIKKARN